MTAIAGLVAGSPFQAAPRAALRMLEAVTAPACTKVDVWQSSNAALGARSPDWISAQHIASNYVVVSDSRLSNRQELCSALGLRQSVTSDAILIGCAYERWGQDCVGHIAGEFVFAIWDLGTSALFCARDRFGVKPLYYRRVRGGLRFGSEAKMIAADTGLGGLPIDQQWVVDFAARLITSATDTPYVDIKRLPSAHFMTWSNGEFVQERYWSVERVRGEGDRNAPEELRAALADAVQNDIASDNTTALLSGGLDSSSICCLASDITSQRAGRPLSTVSLVFDETPEENERTYIEAILAAGRFTPNFVSIPNYRPLSVLGRLIGIHDGPFMAPGQPLMEHAYLAAASDGARVLLDGHGGDEVISHGFGRLGELSRAGNWTAFFAEVIPLSIRRGWNPLDVSAPYIRAYGKGLFGRGARRILALFQKAQAEGEPELLNSSWVADSSAMKRHETFRRRHSGFSESVRNHQGLILEAPLQAHAFEVLNRISRYYGFESRFPFWDQRVVEVCLRAPSSAKLSNGWSRALLRSAMKGVLPDVVRKRRDKLNFAGHAVRGMLRDKEMLLDMARSTSSGLDNFIDLNTFGTLIRQLENSSAEKRGAAAGTVWIAASLGIWLESRRSQTSHAVMPLEAHS